MDYYIWLCFGNSVTRVTSSFVPRRGDTLRFWGTDCFVEDVVLDFEKLSSEDVPVFTRNIQVHLSWREPLPVAREKSSTTYELDENEFASQIAMDAV
jgi:hypothetical protein